MITRFNKDPWWIVTDVDGTLMDHKYDLSPALPTINWLKGLNIPLILCTSKTASEVRLIRKNVGLNDPFIVENGGAVYGNDIISGEEWNFVLGKSYKYLRSKLDLISEGIGYELKPLNDLSISDIKNLTGLNDSQIPLALKREWSVPFLNPPEADLKLILELSSNIDTAILKGNRMSHLLGKGSDKGKAILELKKYLSNNNVKVIALGDSQNDLPLLEVADIAVVVPGNDGPNKYLKDGLDNGDFVLAPAPHGEGWALSVKELISKLL